MSPDFVFGGGRAMSTELYGLGIEEVLSEGEIRPLVLEVPKQKIRKTG